jgi:ubiquinone/menaquinone biosynthesis C-methylase UbiE
VLEGAATVCTGLDISAGMIAVAEQKTKGIPGCRFRVGTGTEIPFDDGSVDLCVGDSFLHHILDIEACLAEVYRVLKPGGIATFNEPSAKGYAFFEFVLRTLTLAGGWQDESLNGYIGFLTFMREHEGDLAALDAYPAPDKHVFSPERIDAAASKVGFQSTSWVPAMGPSPTLWQDAYRFVFEAVKPEPALRATGLEAARLLDITLGDITRQHFCLHNQFFLYK